MIIRAIFKWLVETRYKMLKYHELIPVGFWFCPEQPYLPQPKKLIDIYWNAEEKKKVIDHLKNGKVIESYKGWSECRICNCHNGCQDMTDDVYLWPEGFLHYLEVHSVKPDQKFIDYVLKR